jgi:sulfonate transport system substrate-binding protein
MEQTTTTRTRRSLLRVLAVTAGIWGLSGPVTSNAWAQATGSDKPLRPLQQLRIGYQKAAVNLVIVKQQAVLEKRFPNTQIKWIDFPAGPQLLEALAVGSLEFGLTGDSPPVFAQAAGKDLVYVGVEPSNPESTAILVAKDSPIQKLADLKGKRIALQKGSSAHFLLVSAVEKAGLQWTDIQPIYLAPADARAAFERKSIDAWVIWDPFYAAIELTLAPRVLATGAGLSSNNSFYLASRAFATDYPDVLAVLFDELSRASQFVQQHRTESIKLISAVSGLDAGVVSRFLQRRPTLPVGPISPTTLQSQQRVADTFQKLGLIPKRIDVAQIVWQPKAMLLAKTK